MQQPQSCRRQLPRRERLRGVRATRASWRSSGLKYRSVSNQELILRRMRPADSLILLLSPLAQGTKFIVAPKHCHFPCKVRCTGSDQHKTPRLTMTRSIPRPQFYSCMDLS